MPDVKNWPTLPDHQEGSDRDPPVARPQTCARSKRSFQSFSLERRASARNHIFAIQAGSPRPTFSRGPGFRSGSPNIIFRKLVLPAPAPTAI